MDGTGYFTRALRLAGEAGDTYGVANAAWHAGLTLVRTGHPNEALKLFQLGGIHLGGLAPGKPTPASVRTQDPRVPTLLARLHRSSATAYAVMGGAQEATRSLAEANEGWAPRDAFERATADIGAAGIHLDLGQLKDAEHFAASAVHAFGEGPYRRGRIMAALLLAEVHLRAGEPHGLMLARQALEEVSTLHSLPARRQPLTSLATALDTRPSTDTQDLARLTRQIAKTQT